MKNVLKKIQDTMSAAAFAEAGEFDTARQMLRRGKNANKKVLLIKRSAKTSTKAMEHALNLCQRLEAELEILHVQRSGNKESSPADLFYVSENFTVLTVDYSETGTLQQQLGKKVVEHLKHRRDILCIVLDPSEYEPTLSQGEIFRDFPNWLKGQLHCPVVVCSGSS